MRHVSSALSAVAGFCILSLAGQVGASPLGLTLDLVASSTPCNGSRCPADISLPLIGAAPLGSTAFQYGTGLGTPTNYVAAVTLDNTATQPIVCDEINSVGAGGPSATTRFTLNFTNPAVSAGLLEFGAGGPAIVDLSALSYAGGVAPTTELTYANSATAQELCYPINRIGVSTPFLLNGSVSGDRIFASNFENGLAHVAGEPWVSVQTVNSPSSGGAGKSQEVQMATPANNLVYVVQIHNAVANWHLDFGYDSAYFDPVNNGKVAPTWCVLTSAQPGIPTTCGTSGSVATSPTYTVAAVDIQSPTKSVYLQVAMAGSSAATANWSAQTPANYPAVAAVFPPAGTYPQRLDDKVAVASANNLPVQNVGSIVCTNQTIPVCTLTDVDGNVSQVSYTNSVTAGGVATIDPVAYFVDPTGGTTMPGNVAADLLTVANASCVDPNNILASQIGTGNFITSPSAQGGKALGFTFAAGGGDPFKSGTATCTATFTSPSGFASSLPLSSTQTFTITMQSTFTASLTLTPTSNQTAAPNGTLTFNLSVTNTGSGALSGVGVTDTNPQTDANLTVNSWTCVGVGGGSCPGASGSGGLTETNISLPAGASLAYTITGTVSANIATTPVATQVANNASIVVPTGTSCAGGVCASSANVPTVPIIAVAMNETPTTYAGSPTLVSYTITLTNQGGIGASGLALADPAVAGLTFVSWGCAATGLNSACPAASGSGAISASNIVIGTGGNVTYTLSTITNTTGNVGNTATLTPSGSAVCANGACSDSQTLTYSGP